MAYWSCASIDQHRVELALYFLGLAGYPVFAPRIHAQGKSRPELLFPGYVFLTIESQWHNASRAPGVLRLLMHDDHPAKVPDRVIEGLRAREHNGLIVLPPPPSFKRGDPVRIKAGAFSGRIVLFEGMKPRERCEVLLSFLGSTRPLILPRRDIMRARLDGP